MVVHDNKSSTLRKKETVPSYHRCTRKPTKRLNLAGDKLCNKRHATRNIGGALVGIPRVSALHTNLAAVLPETMMIRTMMRCPSLL